MMRSIRALVPLDEPGIADPFAAIAAAASLAAITDGSATAILAGRDIGTTSIDRAALNGADRIVACTLPGDGPPAIDQWVAAFAALAPEPGIAILPAGAIGEEIAARLAIRLGAVPLGRCLSIDIEGATVATRRATHGGRAEAGFTTDAPHLVAAMRAPVAAPVPCPAPTITHTTVTPPPAACPAVLAPEDAAPRHRRLDGARIVVSGGRGMGGAEGFAQLDALAATLGAAMAGSLPAVDAGWASVSQQVGQSGAFVAPEIYLAIALSGTAQHMAGIGQATRILAVNSDAEADIFRIAELGIVAPWQDVLPRLLDALQEQNTGERP